MAGSADQADFGPPAPGYPGQGIAHLAAGAVGQKAHRIAIFVGRPGGHQHPAAGKVLRAQQPGRGLHNVFGLGQAAQAHGAAGQLSGRGLHHLEAPGPKPVQVLLDHRVSPHGHIHGRAQ